MIETELDILTTDGDLLRIARIPHHPRPVKVATLHDELLKYGWEGRPVILAERDGQIHALTGVNRLNAVSGLDVAVPIVWLPDNLSTDDWNQIDWAVADHELFTVFHNIASRREDMEEVVSVMHEEILNE